MVSSRQWWLVRYGTAVLGVVVAMLLRLVLNGIVGDRFPLLTFFLAVMFAAWYGGLGPALLALVLGWLAMSMWFDPSSAWWVSSSATEIVRLVAYLLVGGGIIALIESQRAFQRRLISEVAERRRAESELIAHRERLLLAQEAGRMGTWDWNMAEGTVVWSPSLEAIHGLEPGSFPGTFEAYQKDMHPEDRDRVLKSIQRSVEDGASHQLEYRIIWPDGSVHWVEARGTVCRDVQGRPERMIGLCIDVTSRNQTDQELRASEQRFRQLADAMPQIVWAARPDGYLDYYNKRWYDFTGFPEGGGDESWTPVLHPDDLERCKEQWYSAVRAGKPYQIEYRFWDRSEGRYRWFLGRALPVRDEAGQVVRWYGSCTDIDEWKRAVNALSESDKRKDEFIAMLAHELRNPLAPVRNALFLLRKTGSLPEGAGNLVAMMDRQIDTITRLVEDLLDVARINKRKIVLRMQVVDLSRIVSAAVESTRPLLEECGHEFSVDLPAEPVQLEADPVRLEQILANLLNNAAKYTEPGGRVSLSARREGQEVIIRVRDSGIGIEPEFLPRIFDLFVQDEKRSDRVQGGLGIGLNLVRSLVEMHSGSIQARSEGSGRGSTFEVRLPALPAGAHNGVVNSDGTGRPVAIEVGSPKVTLPRRRVLVVDDNLDSARTMAMLLRRLWDQDVQTAQDGPESLRLVESFRPDVLLLDIGLPGMNGYEVAAVLRARPEFAHLIIVAMTGWGQPEDLKRSEAAGIDHHLVKPIMPDELHALLSRLEAPIRA